MSYIEGLYTQPPEKFPHDQILLVGIRGTDVNAYNKDKISEEKKKMVAEIKEKLKILPNKKCLIVSDIHPYTFIDGYLGLTKYCQYTGITHFCSRVEMNEEYFELKKILKNVKFVCVPHLIDLTIFKNYGLEKIYDILYYGVDYRQSYPFRNRLRKLLSSDQCAGLKIRIIDRKEKIDGAELSKYINQSWLTTATPSRFNYMVKKYFEIPGSYSVVLGSMPNQGLAIYGDNYIHIDETMSDEMIVGIIHKALQNKKNLLEKTEKMYHLMHQNYNISQFKQLLVKKIQENP